MQRSVSAALAICIVVWIATESLVISAQQTDSRFSYGFLSILPTSRPPKMVIQSVRRAAPELFRDVPTEVRSMGYPLEIHTVRTEDGYILTVHRIPRGKGDLNISTENDANVDSNGGKVRPPIYLQHGIFACSDQWVIGGPGISPALTLADRGYDVWMNNIRGNEYSKKHEKMKRKDPRFWMFSWHEMGHYDIPAVIDYILNTTGQEKLFYIGHSMGNTLFHVAMSTRPEYNSKIRLQISLSPAIYFDEAASAPIRVAAANVDYIKAIVDSWPTYELLLKSESIVSLYYLLCSDSSYFTKLCAVLYSWTVGVTDLNNTTNICKYLARGSGSTSALVPWHFAQNMLSGDFRMLDLGDGNMDKYGSKRPPKYPLNNVIAPIAMYASNGDFVVPTKGVERLAKELSNVIFMKVINETFFNHMDFLFHPRLNELLMNDVLETMERFKP